MRSFKAGDKVKFLNDIGGGVISEILSGGIAKVLIEDGFEIPTSIKELIFENSSEEIMNEIIQNNSDIKGLQPTTPEHIEEPEPEIPLIEEFMVAPRSAVVDMHIWELTDNYSRMANGEMLNIQLDFLVECLESAIDNHFVKVVFIHGVGNGTLKQEIRKILDGYSFIEYHNASMKEYGLGATEVIIKHNK